jgi:protein-disulfide isomerase
MRKGKGTLRGTAHFRKAVGIGLCVLGGVVLLAVGPGKAGAVYSGPGPEKIARFVREKFGFPDSVSVNVEPLRNAVYPGFYQTTITVEQGTEKRSQKINVSANGRYLVLSDFLPLGKDPRSGIVQRVRETFKVPANVKLSVGPFQDSPIPSFDRATVTVDSGGQVQEGHYYVTKDKRFLVLGEIVNLDVDPRLQALHTLNLKNQASEGPASAPVTIVEFADLECPTCARAHLFLRRELLPRYGKKVRLVFKEFPLVQIHPWALQAAIADQCAYEINPAAFAAYRSAIFENQGDINPTNVRDMLLYFGERVGLDRLKLASCIDSKATLPRVEATLREGEELGVGSTPTFYINGRMLVGADPQAFYQAVDEALRAAR